MKQIPVESFFFAVARPASSAILRTSVFRQCHRLGTSLSIVAPVIIDLGNTFGLYYSSTPRSITYFIITARQCVHSDLLPR